MNGAKKWITNGIFADYCTAAVRTGQDGRKGISALVIPMKSKGVTCRKIENSGVCASGKSEWACLEFGWSDEILDRLYLYRVRRRRSSRFQSARSRESRFSNNNVQYGYQHGTVKIALLIIIDFNHERLWLACTSLRLARCCAEDAYNYARVRETFGRKLISNQVIRSKISSFGRSLDSAYAWMEQIVYMFESAKKKGSDAHVSGLIANLKVLAGKTLEHVNRESQQILGGAGYSMQGRGARIEQISRDVRVMVVGGGSEEILTELSLNQEVKATAELSLKMKL